MWIKTIYCTNDNDYASRLTKYMDSKYSSKLEINVCHSVEESLQLMKQSPVDTVLFDEEYAPRVEEIHKQIECTYAFMVNQLYDSSDQSITHIDKYQRADKIYQHILDVYLKGSKVKKFEQSVHQKAKTVLFLSAKGGSGTTTIAKAFATRKAQFEKVLFLDFSNFQIKSQQETVKGMDDIIMALKSRRNTLEYKIMSAVSTTEHKFDTFEACSNSLDFMELTGEDFINLLEGIGKLNEYKTVVVDVGTNITAREIELMKKLDSIIYVMDEDRLSNEKYMSFQRLVEAVQKRDGMNLNRKLLVMKNKLRQSNINREQNLENEVIGWAPYMTEAGMYEAVVEQLSRTDVFSYLEMRYAE